jgi:hypothetical protein
MDTEYLSLIGNVGVDNEYRRQGLGFDLVHQIIRHAGQEADGPLFAIVEPRPFHSEVRSQCDGPPYDTAACSVLDFRRDIAVKVFQSIGLRQTGTLKYLALSTGSAQACHTISEEDESASDCSALPPPKDFGCGVMADILKFSGESEFLSFPQAEFSHQSPTNTMWSRPSPIGDTILHMVAIVQKPRCVAWMMGKRSDFLEQRNALGDTPIRALELTLEEERVGRDSFTGYGEQAVTTLALLKSISHLSKKQ